MSDDLLGERVLAAAKDAMPFPVTDAEFRRITLAVLAVVQPELDRLTKERDGARATVARVEALFAGGPDTPCRTVWIDDQPLALDCPAAAIECVEVPLAELRAALRTPDGGSDAD